MSYHGKVARTYFLYLKIIIVKKNINFFDFSEKE